VYGRPTLPVYGRPIQQPVYGDSGIDSTQRMYQHL